MAKTVSTDSISHKNVLPQNVQFRNPKNRCLQFQVLHGRNHWLDRSSIGNHHQCFGNDHAGQATGPGHFPLPDDLPCHLGPPLLGHLGPVLRHARPQLILLPGLLHSLGTIRTAHRTNLSNRIHLLYHGFDD